MGPVAQHLYPKVSPTLRGLLERALHVQLKGSMPRNLYDISRAVPTSAPFELNMPGPILAIEASEVFNLFVDMEDEKGSIAVFMGSDSEDELHYLGHVERQGDEIKDDLYLSKTWVEYCEKYQGQLRRAIEREPFLPREDKIFLQNNPRSLANSMLYTSTRIGDVFCSLLSEPHLIEKTQLPRAERRRLARDMPGYDPSTRSYLVHWRPATTGRTSERAEDEPSHHKPLHFCRAHWRRYDRPTLHSIQRPGKPDHWVWVKHTWKGHPDYGVVLHDYVPDIEKIAQEKRDALLP